MKQSLLMIVILLAAASSLTWSQDSTEAEPSGPPADREIFVQGGISLPYLPLDFNNRWKNGGNVGVGYGLSYEPGEIGYGALNFMVEYNGFHVDLKGYRAEMLERFPSDTAQINAGNIVKRGRARIVTAMVNFKGSFSATKQTVAPYFLIGMGYMHLSSDSIALDNSPKYDVGEESLSAFAWSAGLGFEVPVTESIGFFAQGRVVVGVSDRTRQHFPLSAGLKLKL